MPASFNWNAPAGRLNDVKIDGTGDLLRAYKNKNREAHQLPPGLQLQSAALADQKTEIVPQQETAAVRIVPSTSGTVAWKIAFSSQNP